MNGLKQVSLALAAAGMLASGVAQAALIDRGGGLLYDDVLNITWLADANYANTNGYPPYGAMTWGAANEWAADLTFHDSVRNVNYADWRLPTALNQDGSKPCYGDDCTNSEMGHMFYNNMGASAGDSIFSGTNVGNLALVKNLQSGYYWFGTAYRDRSAWRFNTADGEQATDSIRGNQFHAWAVRSGDVAAPIPEPETYAMLLAGLGLLGFMARRKRTA